MIKKRSVLFNSAVFTALMMALIVFVYNFNVPNPNMILIAALVLSTSIGGTVPGLICAVMMLIYSLFFFSDNHSFIQFSDTNVQKMVVIMLGVIINFVSVAVLKNGRDSAEDQLMAANEELLTANQKLGRTNEELQKVNELLKSVASIDPLTNLRNRYSLRQDFEMYIGIPLLLAFIDLDNFKQINDENGHTYGDKVLSVVGKALTDCFRTSNCYRYGGDEFLIICENETAESFAASFESAKKQLDSVNISLSGGYVFGTAESIPHLRQMIMQADEVLYDIKKSEKGRFEGCSFRPDHIPSAEASAHYFSLTE